MYTQNLHYGFFVVIRKCSDLALPLVIKVIKDKIFETN